MARSSEGPEEQPVAATDPAVEADLLDQFARLHVAFDDGQISLVDFELRRSDLRARLQV